MVNPISLTAAKAAYDFGDPWLQELRAYLDDNFSLVKEYLRIHLPDAEMNESEATYLSRVNMSKCLPSVEDLPDYFANRAGVLLEGGDAMFVGNASGYIRLNLAMPRAMLQRGLERIEQAVTSFWRSPL